MLERGTGESDAIHRHFVGGVVLMTLAGLGLAGAEILKREPSMGGLIPDQALAVIT
jgi:hypothetical protein